MLAFLFFFIIYRNKTIFERQTLDRFFNYLEKNQLFNFNNWKSQSDPIIASRKKTFQGQKLKYFEQVILTTNFQQF